MAVIDYTFAEETSLQTYNTTANWEDISANAQIGSGNFSVGKKYLIVVSALYGGNDLSNSFGIRVIHGSTAFEESEMTTEPSTGNTSEMHGYFWWTVWTAVSGEAIKLQYKTPSTSYTVHARWCSLMKINLEDDLTEDTDWHYGTDTDSESLSTSWSSSNNASITFTPENANDKWLVLSTAHFDAIAASIAQYSRIVRSGEGSETVPEAHINGEDTVDEMVISLARVFQLGASSNTFTEECKKSEATGSQIRDFSGIFALNLSKFSDLQYSWNAATINLAVNPSYTEISSVTIEPSTTSDMWIFGFACFDPVTFSRFARYRLQEDDSDIPAGQTAAADKWLTWDSFVDEDHYPCVRQAVSTSVSASTTYDCDGNCNNETDNPNMLMRSLFAVTMELAEAGAAFSGAPDPCVVPITYEL